TERSSLQVAAWTGTRVVFSPDGSRFASVTADKGAAVWDVATGDEVLRLDPAIQGAPLAFSSHGTRLALTGSDAPLSVVDVGTGKVVLSLLQPPTRGPRAPPLIKGGRRTHALAFAPDGTRLAWAGDDGLVQVWDTTTGDVLHTLTGLPTDIRHSVSLAFGPDGKY